MIGRALTILTVVLVLAVAGAGWAVYSAVNRAKATTEFNANALQLLLSISGCQIKDTPEKCRQRQVDRSVAEGLTRVIEVECRIRLALSGAPSPPPDVPCRFG